MYLFIYLSIYLFIYLYLYLFFSIAHILLSYVFVCRWKLKRGQIVSRIDTEIYYIAATVSTNIIKLVFLKKIVVQLLNYTLSLGRLSL